MTDVSSEKVPSILRLQWKGHNAMRACALSGLLLSGVLFKGQAGVSADAISHEDYLNAPGESVTTKFTKPGKYTFHCEPHEGAGMNGTVTVE